VKQAIPVYLIEYEKKVMWFLEPFMFTIGSI
jgi:hypothetical protein